MEKTMSDLIKREDAIEALKGREGILPDAYTAVAIIRAIPSADRPQEWIPCSEKLPENGHYYLWCSDMGSVQNDYYWNGFENGQKYGYNIVAWMPLPKPWKGADDER